MRVVGIGMSAGGLEAVSEFFAHLPKGTGAAYVLIQHLSLSHKSIMNELLARHTQLPISVVNKPTVLEADHLYLMPADKNFTFEKGILLVHEREPQESLHLPIDLFFHSLGRSLKEEAIGIILSGSGTDGARGIRTIKENEGLVFVQSLVSAKFEGMPRAVQDLYIADYSDTPANLAKTLGRLLKVPGPKGNGGDSKRRGEENNGYIDRIITAVHKASNINFNAYRSSTLLRRMENHMMLQGLQDWKKYTELIEKDEEAARALARNFLIGVTRFFRDPEAFSDLENNIIPLIAGKKEKEKTIRIWAPACSTGEEAYSLAILMTEFLIENGLPSDNFKIFASDIDTAALKTASRGCYPLGIESDVPPRFLSRYFKKEEDEYCVRPEIQEKILFAAHDALDDPPFIQLDLISCRNLLIYLRPEFKEKLLATFHFALNEDGFLFLGSSESVGNLKNVYEKVSGKSQAFKKISTDPARLRRRFHKKSAIYSREERTPRPGKSLADESYQPENKKPAKTSLDYYYNAPIQEEPMNDPYTRHLLENFAPVCIYVNKNLDVRYLNGKLENFLHLPQAVAQLNLLKMLDRETRIVFRNGVQEAMDAGKPVLYRNTVFLKNNRRIEADLTFQPVEIEGILENIIQIRIDLKSQRRVEEKDVKEVKQKDQVSQHVLSLEKQLNEARKETRRLVDELEVTNEELETSNRELLAANEELQSTNEELQSTNEELYTVNSELQSKNRELNTINNDLDNLLQSTQIGTIFLDTDLRIRKFTPAAQEQFDLLSTDVGRPITSFSSKLKNLDIGNICRQVAETQQSFSQEVTNEKGNHFLLRILPYRILDDTVNGLVITFVNVDDLFKARGRMRDLAGKFEAIFNHADNIILVLDLDGKVLESNRKFGFFDRETLLEARLPDLFPEETGHEIRDALQRMFGENKTQKLSIELAEPGKDRSLYYDLSFIPTENFSDNGVKQPAYGIVLATDNTEREESIRNLETSLNQFKGFMDNAVHQMILVERDSTIRYINRALHAGLSKEEVIGKKAVDFVPPEEREKYLKTIEGVFDGNPFDYLTITHRNEDNEETVFELITTPAIINNKVEYVAVISKNSMKDEV